MSPYSYKKQVRIVIAYIALYNFIIEQRQVDEVLEEWEYFDVLVGDDDVEEGVENEEPTVLDEVEMGTYCDFVRDQIEMAHGI